MLPCWLSPVPVQEQVFIGAATEEKQHTDVTKPAMQKV